ncbi:hypothetical protein CTAYLR_000817 [Chrysophaeum taylorii]|uniref:Aminotransferase class I/classII large domain-containing protein n=1 Tax=Chrysophaeum taylorii TaxID=2483200 RepID=A0AAD7UPM5_9STRA|nr:hypothetical protein CTAYLR_000817 [Chrysophaeum taylorii]
MKEYDVPMEEFMPLTFHIPSGKASEEYSEFADFVRAFETGSTLGDETRKPTDATNLWIIKPASFSNRGFGIRVSNSLDEIREMLEGEARRDVRCGGWIVQKYIEEPLLVFGRKFDVRIFVLLVTDRTTGGGVHGYMHTTANYVRTSSTQYSLAASKVTDRLLHLTNDGVQKTSTRYGKYETGNKLTLDALFDHLVNAGRCAPDWLDTYFWPRIRQIVVYTIDASHDKLNPNDRRNSFELLGYDFMLDDHLKIWLIEVNSNPCLDLCCPHLQRELPLLISDTMRVALDYVLPPPDVVTCPQRHAEALEEIRSSAHGFAKNSDVISLAVAENKLMDDMLLPKLETAARAAIAGTGYVQSWLGMPGLRDRLAALYNAHVLRGAAAKICRENVAVVASATSAIDLLLHCLCEHGDAVLTPAPCYGSYRRDVEARAGCRMLPVPGSRRGELPGLDDLDRALESEGRARVLLVSNPQNPIGSILDASRVAETVAWAKGRGLHVIVDEVFALSCFGGAEFVSALDVVPHDEQRVHVVYSAAKDLALSGYRVGAVFTRSAELMRAFEVLGVFASPSMPAQIAVEALLSDDVWLSAQWIVQLRDRLRASYANAKRELETAGLHVAQDPVAGHFCLLDLLAPFCVDGDIDPNLLPENLRPHLRQPAALDGLIAKSLLDAGVILTPGAPNMGTDTPGLFRLCHAAHAADTVGEGIRRIALANGQAYRTH